ncbi:hypothetical protein AB0K40_17940 [Nonomuraea bangladeshensis]|uniref:ASCH domain-containing protein n=1 Tax=Nonomuraea bangladeshensis TaxID=404385 RepID=A0ABV3H4L8_9ACTN
MIALTIRPPWSFAIAAGWKPIENRTWRTDHRGPLAIHAGARWDHRAALRIAELTRAAVVKTEMSAIVAVAELVDIHHSSTCERTERLGHFHRNGPYTCSPWAMGGDDERGMWHWQLANVRRLVAPVECGGRLRLWELPPDVEAQVLEQIGAIA